MLEIQAGGSSGADDKSNASVRTPRPCTVSDRGFEVDLVRLLARRNRQNPLAKETTRTLRPLQGLLAVQKIDQLGDLTTISLKFGSNGEHLSESY